MFVGTTVYSPTDVEVQARAGDVQAFGQLIRMWDQELRGAVWSVVRSASDTDDIMQNVYEKAFRSIGGFQGNSSLKTWMHSICYRTALDHIRYEKRRRHEHADSLLSIAGSNSTSDDALNRSELAAALEQLDAEQRALLMLTAGLGYSFDETADIVGISRGTVASKVGRARQKLRELRMSEADESIEGKDPV